MTLAAPRFRRIAAPLLLVLALAGAVADAWGHDHGLGADHDGEVYVCQSGHARSLHVEAARPLEISLCEGCLLRARHRAEAAALPRSSAPVPERASLVFVPDPRIDSLGVAGPPGSRGPPSLLEVS